MKPRPIFLPALLLLLCLQGFGQDQPTRLLKNYRTLTRSLQPYLKSGSIASFDNAASNLLLTQKPDQLEFGFEFEGKTWVLVLEKNNPFSKGFHVISASNNDQPVPYPNEIVHYKGKVKGAGKSVVALTVLPDRIAAVVSDASVGNINIASLKNKTNPNSNEHIIYRDTDLLIPNEANCNTKDDTDPHNDFINNYVELAPTATTVNAEPIDIYFEADYAIYNNNGSSISNVVNYVTTLFNVVNVIFENDSINVRINAIKVWDTPDPYISQTTASGVLTLFGADMAATMIPGDFAHFLSQRSLGGGVAYVNSACSGNSSKTAVSGNLSNSFNVFPTYSWSAMVITHELGHNFGSSHTHSCSWPGGAIDNCYTTEGGCPAGPAPVNGGTIMSYCHLTGNGINFANGFGPLPGARIRNVMRNNPCISPGVYFTTVFSTRQSEELADSNNGCLPYKLVTAKLAIPYAPSQPANISLVPTGDPSMIIGTNKDIEISPLSFTLDAGNLSQTINLKLYNDGLVEPDETMLLNFNLNSNGGNAVKRNISNNIQVTITNDDAAPDQFPNRIIFTEDFESVGSGLGVWTQSIVYGASSPNRWMIGSNGDSEFTSKAAFVSNNGSTANYSGSSVADSTIIRLISPIINTSTFSNLVLSASYKCNGEGGEGGSQGVSGAVDFGRVLYSLNGGSSWFVARDNILFATRKGLLNFTLPVSTANIPQLRIAFEWINNSSVVNNPGFIIDSIVLKGAGAATIQSESDPNNIQQENLGPFETIHFYNKQTKNVMASIQNNSSFDFGCTTVELLRTGNGSTQAWGQFVDQQISSKLFRISSTNVDNNAPYTIKLYFTEAEINGWLAGTGNKIDNLSLAKTNQDISTINPSAQPVFSSNSTLNPFGVNNGRVISATFTGFGYFAIAKVYVPPACVGGINSFTSAVSGSAYQWQVNSGSGYVNLTNNAIYSGVSTSTLQLNNAPTTQYGYKYRCLVTTPFGNVYSPENTLRFESSWLGTISTAWENPLNWSCGRLPDANTDVVVNSGTAFTLELNTSVSIRSLRIPSTSNISIKAGNNLTILK